MNLQETTTLCIFVRSVVPAQTFDEQTPLGWQTILADVPFNDAKDAAMTLARSRSFISPGDIAEQVRVIRLARLDRQLPAPNVDPADVGAYLEETRAIRDAVANGDMGDDEIAEYERGGRTLTGVPARYGLDSPMISRADIAAKFASVFRDARGQRKPLDAPPRRRRRREETPPATDDLAPAPWESEGAS